MRILLALSGVLLLLSCITSTQAPAPVTFYGTSQGPGSSGAHTVAPGDTLYSISERYKISMQDIVYANTLRPPFTLEVGQRITLPPPQHYKVRAGDTLYSVSRLFDTSTNEIAAQNNLSSPYILKPGQVLKLPSISRGKTHSGDGGKKIASRHDGGNTSQTITGANEKVTRSPLYDPDSEVSDTPVDVADIFGKEKSDASVSTGKAEASAEPSSEAKTASANVKRTPIKTKAPKRASSKFLSPVRGEVISKYGTKSNGLHNDGINIKAPRGMPVKAAENGVIVYAGNELKGSGNLVLMRHEGGWMTAYAHLDSIGVTRGAVVNRGQVIGKVGSTGSVNSPQLHFEIRKGTNAVNPQVYVEQ